MTPDDLRLLFEYSYWANNRLFETVSSLTDEEFCRTVAGSYGSVRNTLVHILSAEWGWLDRCGGHPRGAKLNAADFATAAQVRTLWAEVERHMRSFLSSLTPDDVARSVEYSFGGGPMHRRTVGQLLWHAANHGSHHRGQVALLLRLIDRPAKDFDVLHFHPEAV